MAYEDAGKVMAATPEIVRHDVAISREQFDRSAEESLRVQQVLDELDVVIQLATRISFEAGLPPANEELQARAESARLQAMDKRRGVANGTISLADGIRAAYSLISQCKIEESRGVTTSTSNAVWMALTAANSLRMEVDATIRLAMKQTYDALRSNKPDDFVYYYLNSTGVLTSKKESIIIAAYVEPEIKELRVLISRPYGQEAYEASLAKQLVYKQKLENLRSNTKTYKDYDVLMDFLIAANAQNCKAGREMIDQIERGEIGVDDASIQKAFEKIRATLAITEDEFKRQLADPNLFTEEEEKAAADFARTPIDLINYQVNLTPEAIQRAFENEKPKKPLSEMTDNERGDYNENCKIRYADKSARALAVSRGLTDIINTIKALQRARDQKQELSPEEKELLAEFEAIQKIKPNTKEEKEKLLGHLQNLLVRADTGDLAGDRGEEARATAAAIMTVAEKKGGTAALLSDEGKARALSGTISAKIADNRNAVKVAIKSGKTIGSDFWQDLLADREVEEYLVTTKEGQATAKKIEDAGREAFLDANQQKSFAIVMANELLAENNLSQDHRGLLNAMLKNESISRNKAYASLFVLKDPNASVDAKQAAWKELKSEYEDQEMAIVFESVSDIVAPNASEKHRESLATNIVALKNLAESAAQYKAASQQQYVNAPGAPTLERTADMNDKKAYATDLAKRTGLAYQAVKDKPEYKGKSEKEVKTTLRNALAAIDKNGSRVEDVDKLTAEQTTAITDAMDVLEMGASKVSATAGLTVKVIGSTIERGYQGVFGTEDDSKKAAEVNADYANRWYDATQRNLNKIGEVVLKAGGVDVVDAATVVLRAKSAYDQALEAVSGAIGIASTAPSPPAINKDSANIEALGKQLASVVWRTKHGTKHIFDRNVDGTVTEEEIRAAAKLAKVDLALYDHSPTKGLTPAEIRLATDEITKKLNGKVAPTMMADGAHPPAPTPAPGGPHKVSGGGKIHS